jgi:hypothetical protein
MLRIRTAICGGNAAWPWRLAAAAAATSPDFSRGILLGEHFRRKKREHVFLGKVSQRFRNRLQLFDFEPLLLARVIQPEPKRL